VAKVIGIIGSRRRDTGKDFDLIEKAFLNVYEQGDAICSGGCPKGGDKFAIWLSQKYMTKYIEYKPEWDKYGKGAGFIRNTQIANKSNILIACVSEDRIGGTEDTIKKYLAIGKTELILV